jgi:Amt family ammonium transporter
LVIVERLIRGKASVLGGASGAVAGLVVITPAAGFVGVGGALIMGLIGGVVCFWGITALKRLLKADDALDALVYTLLVVLSVRFLTGVFYSDEIIKAANVALLQHSLVNLGSS